MLPNGSQKPWNSCAGNSKLIIGTFAYQLHVLLKRVILFRAMDTFLRHSSFVKRFFLSINGLFYLLGKTTPAVQTARQRPSFSCSHIPSDLKLQSMIFDVKVLNKGSTLS